MKSWNREGRVHRRIEQEPPYTIRFEPGGESWEQIMNSAQLLEASETPHDDYKIYIFLWNSVTVLSLQNDVIISRK